MVEFSHFMPEWVVIEEKQWFSIEGIRIFGMMVSKGMMSPMLLHPVPFTSPDEISSKTKDVIDPCTFRRSSVVGIMLYIKTNECLCDTKGNGEWDGGSSGGSPLVVHVDHESNVEEGTEEVSWSSKFTSAAYDFEYLAFDFSFKVRVENVAVVVLKIVNLYV